MAEDGASNTLELTVALVAAYLEKNPVRAEEIPGIILNVHGALGGLGKPQPVVQPEKREPAVAIKKSVQPDFIVCLEDGKKQKSLKRHLQSAHGLTPQQYREKWNLGREYPMVAPNYAAARSELARNMGLGRGGRPAAASAPAGDPAPAKRRRVKKA